MGFFPNYLLFTIYYSTKANLSASFLAEAFGYQLFTVYYSLITYHLLLITASVIGLVLSGHDRSCPYKSDLKYLSGAFFQLFTLHCLLFTVYCLLFTVYCLLFTVHISLITYNRFCYWTCFIRAR